MVASLNLMYLDLCVAIGLMGHCVTILLTCVVMLTLKGHSLLGVNATKYCVLFCQLLQTVSHRDLKLGGMVPNPPTTQLPPHTSIRHKVAL